MHKTIVRIPQSKLLQILFFLLPVIYTAFLHLIDREIDSRILFDILLFFIMVSFLTLTIDIIKQKSGKYFLILAVEFSILILIIWLSFSIKTKMFSWILLGNTILFSLHLKNYLVHYKSRIINLTINIIYSVIIGSSIILLDQIQTSFSEEEFFVAIQAIKISIFIFLLIFSYERLKILLGINLHPSIPIYRNYLTIGIVLFYFTFLYLSLNAYQDSFFPKTSKQIPGISYETPFLCEDINNLDNDSQLIDSKSLLHKVTKKIIENPNKGLPEFAFLTLVTEDEEWLNLFSTSLLYEARSGKYTEPANSIKFGQLDAAIRIYYFSEILKKYPELFSQTELLELKEWFANINRRAMTVEWVDWMYSSAFSMFPIGPYENQEIGAGLISMLLLNNLSANELKQQNITYLEEYQRGWFDRFRNTDDAFVYQSTWIINAYFQSLYFKNNGEEENIKKSFEWIMNQILPNGASPSYNMPYENSSVQAMMLGAYLTGDGRFLWSANKQLEYLDNSKINIYAYPGIEKLKETDILAIKPKIGTCLIYGDSGLPTQKGPLSPDKLIFRSGWDNSDKYILINLRSSGWHKYKGTNTVSIVYENGIIIGEELNSETYSWLPKGRSAFRDKRIPREILNGLIVERYGLNQIICTLISCDSNWAQNPPSEVEIIDYSTNEDYDYAKLQITWASITHEREIYFYKTGPIFILDIVEGKLHSGINWNFIGDNIITKENSKIMITDKNNSVIINSIIKKENPITPIVYSNNNLHQIRIMKIDDEMQLLTTIFTGDFSQTIETINNNRDIIINIIQDSGTTSYRLIR